MAKMARKSKTVVTNVTQEKFNEALSTYALNDAEACKLVAKMDMEITKIREKYTDDLERMRQIGEENMEIVMAFATENKKTMFADARSIDTPHGRIGFRLGTPKLKTLPKFKWEDVLEKVRMVMPQYVRKTEEVDKEGLIRDRAHEEIGKHLNDVGVYVDQDEKFFIDLKKEEAAVLAD